MHTLLTLYLGIAVSEWERRLVVECNEVDGFHLPAVTYAADNAKESISHNDLLLLSKEKVKWSLIVFAFNFYISMHFNIQFLSIFFLSGGFALCLSHCVSARLLWLILQLFENGVFWKSVLAFPFLFLFLGGWRGGHIWETMYLGVYCAMFCFLQNFWKRKN